MSAHDLFDRCNEALRRGIDFPTLWQTVIRPDPPVIGIPVQRLDGNCAYLEIPLLRGNSLIVDNESRVASLR